MLQQIILREEVEYYRYLFGFLFLIGREPVEAVEDAASARPSPGLGAHAAGSLARQRTASGGLAGSATEY
jgi:hypothetical protein